MSSRGRPVSSKPLTATASTASSRASNQLKSTAPSAPSASTSTMKISNVTRTTHKIIPRNPPPAARSANEAAGPSDDTTPAATPDAQPTTDHPTAPLNPDDAPKPTSDPLQVAAQAYPWLYMSNTLEACFKTAEEKAQKDIDTRTQELEAEESEIADQRVRFETERALDFYDELSTDTFTKDAPIVMQGFLSHGDACSRIETEALELASRVSQVNPEDTDPLQVYYDMLDKLEELQAEAAQLETSITRLTAASEAAETRENGKEKDDEGKEKETEEEEKGKEKETEKEEESSSAREQIVGVFAACLPVLRARIANLTMAQDLVETATENLSLTLRMESMGIE